MARVKRSVNGKKHRRAILEEAQGYTGSRSRHFRKANEQVMHSLPVRVPRPAGPQGRVPPALDRAHQRRVPRARHVVLAVHRRVEGGRGRRRPQDPRRPRGARAGDVRRARRDRTRGPRRRLSARRAPKARSRRRPRLRPLLRDRERARRTTACSSCEGPRVVAAALDQRRRARSSARRRRRRDRRSRRRARRAGRRAACVELAARRRADRVGDTAHAAGGVRASSPRRASASTRSPARDLVLVAHRISPIPATRAR